MKEFLTILIVTASSVFGEACDLIEPKFDSIEIEAPDILTALGELESKAQKIYEQYDTSPALRIFDLSASTKKRIKYTATEKSVLEAATELLELNKSDYYISDTETIWIGVSEKRINKITSRYPIHLKETRIPLVNIRDASITDVEKTIASLWDAYCSDPIEWRLSIFRESNQKINIQMREVDIMSLVVYLDLLNTQ